MPTSEQGETYSRTISVRVTEAQHAALTKAASEMRRSLSDFVRLELVEAWMAIPEDEDDGQRDGN